MQICIGLYYRYGVCYLGGGVAVMPGEAAAAGPLPAAANPGLFGFAGTLETGLVGFATESASGPLFPHPMRQRLMTNNRNPDFTGRPSNSIWSDR